MRQLVWGHLRQVGFRAFIFKVVADYCEHPEIYDESSSFFQDWEAAAMSFLQRDLEEESSGSKTKAVIRQVYRQKSYEMLCCWENILKVTTGLSLDHCQDLRFADKPKQVIPCRWPLESPPSRTIGCASSWTVAAPTSPL